MNIFALESHPAVAARIQHDRHVVKMILESAQMLSTACQVEGDPILRIIYDDVAKSFPDPSLYKPTHENHPASIWARKHPGNFVWLSIHMYELLREYHRRFQKSHKCTRLAYLFGAMSSRLSGNPGFLSKEPRGCLSSDYTRFTTQVTYGVEVVSMTRSDFIYCGPKQYGTAEGVRESYRRYYLAEKVAGNRWTVHPDLILPGWLAPHATLYHRPDNPAAKRAKRVLPLPKPKPFDRSKFGLKLK